MERATILRSRKRKTPTAGTGTCIAVITFFRSSFGNSNNIIPGRNILGPPSDLFENSCVSDMRPVVHANRHRVNLSIHGGVLQTHLAKVLKRKRLVKVIIKFLKNAHGKIASKNLVWLRCQGQSLFWTMTVISSASLSRQDNQFQPSHWGTAVERPLLLFPYTLFNAGSSWIENA